MRISYDMVIEAFLLKISEYSFLEIPEEAARNEIVENYMKRAIVAFKNVCKYDLTTTQDNGERKFNTDILDEDVDELLDIISEGMIVQWLKPYLYKQELLQNSLNTKDFTTYSSSGLLDKVREVYKGAQQDFTQAVREYSYNKGELSDLHL